MTSIFYTKTGLTHFPEPWHKPRMRFRLMQIRNARGLSQEQVAEGIGVAQPTYQRLETGKRRITEKYMRLLAEFYDISPARLIVDDERDDPLYEELDAAWRRLSPAERQIAVSAVKGIADARETSD